MSAPYTITKSNGTTLTTVYPMETNGPDGLSTPFQVGCRFDVSIVSIAPGQIILSGNVATLFGVGFKFTIVGSGLNNGNYTVATSTYNLGLNQTFINPTTSVVTDATPGTAELHIFLLSGDQTQPPNRFTTGFTFEIINTPNPSAADVGTYTVLTGYNAVYDTVSGYTAIPVAGPIAAANPFPTSQYQLQYAIGANSVLLMTGQNSLNWGSKIWENLVRMTEHFADGVSPDVNTNIGSNAPLVGQIWYNTGTSTFEFWNGTNWINLSSGIGTISGAVTSVTGSGAGINVSPTAGAVVVTNTGVTSLLAGTGISLTGSTGAITISTTTHGTVTSVSATGSTGLTVGGSPITSSGTLTLTLSANLQSLSGISGVGFVQYTGSSTFTSANLTASQVNSALGYTAYSSANPSGFITGNQTITLSGAVTGSGTTSIATTLANSGVTAGTYGSATNVPAITVNSKGIVISASNVAIPVFTSGSQGEVPASGGGTTNFMRADGSWAPPSGTAIVNAATSTLTRTSSSGVIADPSLSITLAANSVYSISVLFFSDSGDGVYMGLYYSGSITSGHWGGYQSYGSGGIITGNSFNATYISGSYGNALFTFHGTIYTGTAGTLSFNWGNSGAGGSMYRFAGSCITATKCF